MANSIKSFEEGEGVAGDILTSGKIKRKVKVGLLTCGYFEYWRMYPSLREKVEADLAVVTRRIRCVHTEIVESGMVDTLDTADAAGKLFRQEDVDMVLLVYGTYIPDFISLTVLNRVADKPLMIFSTQVHKNVDQTGNYEGSLRNSAVIGIAQLTGTLRKMRRDFKIVVGSLQDDRAYRKIARRIGALQAVADLNEANIGVIGHVFRGMYDLELSKTFLKNTFGVNVIMIQNSHLLEVWRGVTEEEAESEAKQLTARFKIRGVTDGDVCRAMRLAVAMRRIAERFHLNAMCFLDQHYVQKQVRTSARMGASLLMERTDMSVNCEGDLGGLITMMLMRSVSGSAAFMAEWGEFDEKTNSCLLIGHGIGTPDLTDSDSAVTLTRTPEEWGFEGAGLNYELIVRPGLATIGHLMEGADGYRMLISPVESIEFPKLDFEELHALVRTRSPVKEYLEKLFGYGVAHHCILGLGDMAEELKMAAELLKIETFTVS